MNEQFDFIVLPSNSSSTFSTSSNALASSSSNQSTLQTSLPQLNLTSTTVQQVNNTVLKSGTTIGSKTNGSLPTTSMAAHSSAPQLINAGNFIK